MCNFHLACYSCFDYHRFYSVQLKDRTFCTNSDALIIWIVWEQIGQFDTSKKFRLNINIEGR